MAVKLVKVFFLLEERNHVFRTKKVNQLKKTLIKKLRF